MKSLHFIEKISICVAFGLVLDIILLSIIGIVYVGYEVLLLITAVSYALIFFTRIFKIINLPLKIIDGFHENRLVILKKFYPFKMSNFVSSSRGIVHLLVMALVVGHFSIASDYMGWPPGLDAIKSGLLASLIKNNHKLETDLSPISPGEPWFEPFGFPIMSAYFSTLFNIFPGESVLVFATTVMILILLSMYTAAYRLTGSLSLAVLVLISGFYIYPITNDIRFLEKWLIGYYYNTPYPNLLGYLTLMQFIILQFAVSNKHLKKTIHSRMITATTLAGIGLAYTPFIILPLFYISTFLLKRFIFYLISRLKKLKVNTQSISNSIAQRKRAIVALSLLVVFLGIVTYEILSTSNSKTGPEKFWTLLQRIQANSYYYSGIVLNPEIFTNLTGIWTVITSAAAIISLIKKNRVNLSVFYLMFSVPILLTATNENIFGSITWPLFPGRLFAFLIVFDWIILATYIHDILSRANKSNKAFPAPLLRTSISISLIIVFFLPSFISHLTLEQADNWDWNFGRDKFKNDYALFSWLSENINSSDLIMVDYSYASKSIHSFSLKNITYNLFPSTAEVIERDKESLIVWERPSLLRSYVDKNNITYVLVDSEPYHRVPPEVGGDNVHTHKTFNVEEYNEIFKQMPFLQLVKQFGLSSLYKVIQENQSSSQEQSKTH